MVYFLYDWPTVLDTSSNLSDINAIDVLSEDKYFVVIRNGEILFYDQHTFKQRCRLQRPAECIRLHGATVSSCSSMDSTLLALFTTFGYLLLMCLPSIPMTSKNKDTVERMIDDDSLDGLLWEDVCKYTLNMGFLVTCSCYYNDLLFVASSNGQLCLLQWEGTSIANFALDRLLFYQDVEYSRARRISDSSSFCVALEWAPTLGGVMSILSSGEVALLQPQMSTESHWTLEGVLSERVDQPCSLAVNDRFRTVAVGTMNTDVALYRLDETSGVIFVHQHVRISNRECPDASSSLGPAVHLSWSPDGYCLAIAWKNYGWALCSVFGALLHTSLGERIGLTDRVRLSHLAWSAGGCQLISFLSFLDPNEERIQSSCTSVPVNTIENESASLLVQNHAKTDDPFAHLVVFHLVRSAVTTNPTLDNHRHVILQTVDRIMYSSRSQLTLSRSPQTIPLPLVYLRQNWPTQYVAANTDGDRIAVAGRRGFAHYHCITGRWNVFANEVQERSIHIRGGLTWWNRFVCCTCLVIDKGTFEFRMYPSEMRLDNQFVSAYRFFGQAEPLLLDCLDNIVTVLAADGRVQILHISTPDSDLQKLPLVIVLLQTIDLTNLILFPTCVVRLCLCSMSANLPHSVHHSKTPNSCPSDTMQCASNSTSARGESANIPHLSNQFAQARSLLINYAGHVFILQPSRTSDDSTNESDPDRKRPLILTPFLIATHVELIWTTASVSVQDSLSHTLDWSGAMTSSSPNEVLLAAYLNTSLWLYCGSSGLYVWLPLPTMHPSSPANWNHDSPIHPGFLASHTTYSPDWRRHGSTHLTPGYVSRRIMLSIELEDHVHPLVVLFHQAILVGIMNDFHRPLRGTTKNSEPHFSLDDFYSILPHGVLLLETNAFLHRLIQQLLRLNLGAHALHLCSAYQNVPHFRRLLEWLLHEVLESEATSKSPIPDPLLPQVVAFIQEFPHFLETVAQCARKTEVARWPHLFTAVGRRPKDLFDLCLDEGNLHAAAAYLIILQSSESTTLSQQCTLRLLDIAIDKCEWDLIRELIRFLSAIDPCELKCLGVASPGSHSSSLMHSVNPDFSTTRHSRMIPGDRSNIEKIKGTKTAVETPTASVQVVPTRCPRKSSSRTESECDSASSSSSLSDHIWQLVVHKASEYFAHGRIREMAELAANFPALLDAASSRHPDRLANWIASQKPETHLIANWPECLMRLHQSFAYPLPDSTNAQSDRPSDTTPVEQRIVDANPMVRDSRSLSTHLDLTFRRLRFLLSQLLQAESFEWACLVALMVRDHTGVSHSVTLAVASATKSALARLKDCHVGATSAADVKAATRVGHRMAGTPTTSILRAAHSDRTVTPVFGDPLSRVLAGLSQLNLWAMENCSSYHHFLESLQPELDQVVKQASSFLGQCASGSLPDELRVIDNVVTTGHEIFPYGFQDHEGAHLHGIQSSTDVSELDSHSEKHVDLAVVSPTLSEADESETVSSEASRCTLRGSQTDGSAPVDCLFETSAQARNTDTYEVAVDPILHIGPTVCVTTTNFDGVDPVNSYDFLVDGTGEVPLSRTSFTGTSAERGSCRVL